MVRQTNKMQPVEKVHIYLRSVYHAYSHVKNAYDFCDSYFEESMEELLCTACLNTDEAVF